MKEFINLVIQNPQLEFTFIFLEDIQTIEITVRSLEQNLFYRKRWTREVHQYTGDNLYPIILYELKKDLTKNKMI